MDINYGIIAITDSDDEDNLDVVHFCGYEDEPTDDDFNSLYDELSTDPDFGLTEIMDKIMLLSAPIDIVEHFRSMIEAEEIDID